jgi:S-DNA-T family DNA segregation ATPase FtsK/SpoIIIE
LVVANKKRRDEIEQLLSRLGSKARAAGIHIVLATQRPSRDVIRGAINANLPTRIGLKVASAIEARIIETPGAEHLLGKGDLLFKAIGEPRRLQGAVVTAEELERIASQAEPVTAV